MPGLEDLQIESFCPRVITGQEVIHREVVGRHERTRMLRAEYMTVTFVEILVQAESITELAEGPISSTNHISGAERLFVIVVIEIAELLVGLGAPGLGVVDPAHRLEHRAEVAEQNERALVVVTDRALPRGPGGLGEREASIVAAGHVQESGQ